MGILIDRNSRILVQGITGKSGRLQTQLMLESGSRIVAGVTPGKGGQLVCGVPVYNTVAEAKQEHGFDTAICFVPPAAVKSCCFEAMDAGVRLYILCTEQVPMQDVSQILAYARRCGTTLIGPGCSGVIVPGCCKVGSHPVRFFRQGSVGVVSKSGALSYETGMTLTEAGIGQSSVVGIGGGPCFGFTQRDAVECYEKDPDTKIIVLLGEIGGDLEEEAARYIKKSVTKPVVALIVGRNAPRGKSLGHAGAIVSGDSGTADSKIRALREAGVFVVSTPLELTAAVSSLLHETEQNREV